MRLEATTRKPSFKELKKLIDDNNIDGIKAAMKLDGFDVNIRGPFGRTALHHAASSDKAEILGILLSHADSEIDETDKFGCTALIYAAKHGARRSVEILLANGADDSLSDVHRHVALWYASFHCHLECVEILLRNKNSVLNELEEDVIYESVHEERIIETLKKIIIESSADPFYLTKFGPAVFYYALETGSLDTIKLIVENCDYDGEGEEYYNGESPLHIALSYSYLEIADYLIEKGAYLTAENEDGQSAYDYAAIYDDTETFLEKYEPTEKQYIVKLFEALIENSRYKTLRAYAEKCADNDYPDGQDILNLAVSFAFENDYVKSMTYLLFQTTDKYHIIELTKRAIDEDGESKFKLFELMFQRFLELETDDVQIKKINSDLFVKAILNRNSFVIEYIFDRGLDPNEIKFGRSYLALACCMENMSLIESLLELGADVNHLDHNQWSALYYATERNNLEIVQLLLKHGADPRTKSNEGFTPLMLSVINGNTVIFSELFKVDKDLSQRSSEGMTLFMAACKSGNVQMVKAIFEVGACPTDVDNKNQNCLHYVANGRTICESMVYLFEKLDKRYFYSMIQAADARGDQPLDIIRRKCGKEMISELVLAIPDLRDLIVAPIYTRIQTSSQEICLICRDEFLIDDCIVVLPCSHIYHESCYAEWGKRREICPYCQKSTYSLMK